MPAGTPAWLSHDASRWAGGRPPRWVWPGWSALALLLALVMTIAVALREPCSDAVPCSADWPGMVSFGLSVALPFWYFRLSELALVAAPLVALDVVRHQFDHAHDMATKAVDVGVIAAPAFGCAAAWQRVGGSTNSRSWPRAYGTRCPGLMPCRGAGSS